LDFDVSKSGLAAVISTTGVLYTWGPNDYGQLGHGDFAMRATPQRVKGLEGKRVT
jgi:alpha-tubulin suppressor-like RCC1 family protein